MKLAVIPARGGSKRIPRKNIKLFGGKPMIAWSIEAAQRTGLFDNIVVSTDDAETASVAIKYGAKVPFIRPAELADDHTGISAVIAHAVEWHIENAFEPKHICCVYATAPFIRSEDIQQGLDILQQSGAEFAVAVTSYAFPIQRAVKLRKDGRIEMFDPVQFRTRSQDLQLAYHDAGQFYWGTTTSWQSGTPVLSPDAAPVFLPRYRVQDIDNPEDWEVAEQIFKSSSKSISPR